MTLSQAVFAAENVTIALGYFWALAYVVPLLPIRRITTVAGCGFFWFCALTHFEHAVHTLFEDYQPAWHDHYIHAPQAVAIWVFLIRFRVDIKALNKRNARRDHDA